MGRHCHGLGTSSASPEAGPINKPIIIFKQTWRSPTWDPFFLGKIAKNSQTGNKKYKKEGNVADGQIRNLLSFFLFQSEGGRFSSVSLHSGELSGSLSLACFHLIWCNYVRG